MAGTPGGLEGVLVDAKAGVGTAAARVRTEVVRVLEARVAVTGAAVARVGATRAVMGRAVKRAAAMAGVEAACGAVVAGTPGGLEGVVVDTTAGVGTAAARVRVEVVRVLEARVAVKRAVMWARVATVAARTVEAMAAAATAEAGSAMVNLVAGGWVVASEAHTGHRQWLRLSRSWKNRNACNREQCTHK